MMSLSAADYLGTGAIEVNDYEPVITDMVRRQSVALQRFKQVPATGQPHRYFEQTAIAQGAFTTTGGQGLRPSRQRQPAQPVLSGRHLSRRLWRSRTSACSTKW
jgi:hypothetical protein